MSITSLMSLFQDGLLTVYRMGHLAANYRLKMQKGGRVLLDMPSHLLLLFLFLAPRLLGGFAVLALFQQWDFDVYKD